MSYFFYFIVLVSIKKIFSDIINSKKFNSNEGDFINILLDMKQCYENYSSINDTLYMKCLIIDVKKFDMDYLYSFMKEESTYLMIKNFAENDDKLLLDILNALELSVKQKTDLIDNIFEVLKSKDSFNLTILDYIENIIDTIMIEEFETNQVFGNISMILQIECMRKVFDYFMDNYENLLYEIIEMLVRKHPFIMEIYKEIMNPLSEYKKKIFSFVYDLLKNYFDRNNATITIAKFLADNKDMYSPLKTLIRNENVKYLLKHLFINENSILNSIKDIILDREEALNLFFTLSNYPNIVDEVVGLILNYNNNTYIVEQSPSLLYDVKQINETYILIFLRNFMYFLSDYKGKETFIDQTLSSIQEYIRSKFIEKKGNYDISNDCLNLFRDFFLKDLTTKDYILKYLRKFLVDSPLNKGDFMAFDNCLYDNGIITNISYNLSYDIKPVFVIGIFDEKNLSNYTNSIYYEKYNYIVNFCFPFGYNKINKNPICSDDDYDKFTRFLVDIVANFNNMDIKTIILYDDKIRLNSHDYLVGIFSMVFLGIPILIKIVLKINECIIDKKRKNNEKKNKLLIDKNEKNVSRAKSYYEDELKLTKKSHLPKCHKILKNYVSFYENGKELFNFDLNNTNFNNINGITYIKGLIGLSIIFNAFGLTFTTLMNIHMKDFGIWKLYRTLNNLFFVFLFIGYRYSPRILFSCSGYTLVYKYLCFIEQEKGLYFLKFIFLQSYKYIFLYLILILFKYSVLRIIYLFRGSKRPVWALFEYFLDNEEFISSAFALLFDFKGLSIEGKKQNLVYNFYMPINEIFFFLFGTILISLGYKYKLRIDFIIIGIILSFFIIKIFIFCFKSGKSYTTIDYYIFNFGIVLLNPLYNISYFLIGMYFGLINYSIQKGITNIYKENRYEKYYQLEESQKKYEKKEENSIYTSLNINGEDNEILSDSELSKDNLDKYLSRKENNKLENKMELIEQIKNMPFLRTPIQFLNLNKRNKDRCCYKILIVLAIFIMILLCYIKTIFIDLLSLINNDLENKEYKDRISLEKIIPNYALNIINLLDTDVIVFLIHWIIFLLFFKEVNIIREFFNNIYWSFFVKSYYTYILISAPVVLCILYESESVIKLDIYNFILFSLINIIYILSLVIVSYSVYELPLKKIFKNIIKGNENIDIEEDDENDEGDGEEDETKEEILELDDEEEVKPIKK